MAITIGAGFKLRSPQQNFERDSYSTLEEMKNVVDSTLPDIFTATCLETGKFYIYLKSNTIDETFGKWREIQGGSTETTDWDSLIGKPFKDVDENIFTVDENGLLSVVIPEVPIEKIKVNGTELTIDESDKSVDIDLTDYENIIEKISVNGTEIEPTDKTVDITIPTVSAEEGNQIEEKEDGLYVSAYDDTAISERVKTIEDDYLTSVDKTEITENLEEKLDKIQPAENAGKIIVVSDDGTLTFTDPAASSGDTAENIAYVNADYSQYSNVDLALDALFAKVYYVKPSCSLSASPTGGTFEIGTTIAAPITFTWTTNKDIKTQSLTDCTLADETVRTATYDTDITTDKTFTLSVSDGENSATSSVSYRFMNNIFWGSAPVGTYDSAFINGLSNKKLANSANGTYNMTIATDEYGFWAVPSNITITSVWIGGFEVTLESLGTISYTNSQDYTRDYNLYKTGQSGLGNISAEIK